MPDVTIELADALNLPLVDDGVDLVVCSPPYEDARTYGIDFKLKEQAWVDWCVPRYMECLRVCRGLVVWVLQGKTRQFQWSCVPARLIVALQDLGVSLRCPPIYHRVGIPGSGGPDWWRNDYEFCICGQREQGRLPWSDNTATGHEPRWGVGGPLSHRLKDGRRVNGSRIITPRGADGTMLTQGYKPPKKANPGNALPHPFHEHWDFLHCDAGGGRMGSKLAHENEAPYPEALVEPFIKSFCPPSGIVLDPFCGSGTTLAVALKNDRNAVGYDIRQSQVDLSRKRIEEVQLEHRLFNDGNSNVGT